MAIAALAVVLAMAHFLRVAGDPDVYWLRAEDAAQWIILDRPFCLIAHSQTDEIHGFRTTFHVAAPPTSAKLTARGFRSLLIMVDDKPVQGPAPPGDLSKWKDPVVVDLAPGLEPGDHTLTLLARNMDGPPGVLAYCEALGIRTDESWRGSDDLVTWVAVRTADAVPMTESRQCAMTGPQALAKVAGILAAIVISACVSMIVLARRVQRWGISPGGASQRWPIGSAVRWGLLLAWAALAANNLFKLGPSIGFDRQGHMEYILMIAVRHRLPLATEGWQMFQSPLYYLLSAPAYWLGSALFDEEGMLRVLRLIPLMCGIAQIEITFRTLRMAFPKRPDLQAMGTVLGGLLPMNLYISQALGNEPLAGVLIAATIGLAFAVACGSDRCRTMRWMALLGTVWGLALLSKATAGLLAVPLVLWLAGVGWTRGEPVLRIVRRIGVMVGCAAIVAGWYYVRNWIELGKPFVGGWDPMRGIVWWQDPGYRTLRSIITFGDALIHPLSPQTMGIWDALYSTFWCDGFLSSAVDWSDRPPWNYPFLIAGAWLGLFPSLMMLAGGLRAIVRNDTPVRLAALMAVSLVGLFLAAMLDLYLHLPIYSTAKATYTLGLTPAYALLFVVGADWFCKSIWGRATVVAMLACWGVCAYLAFFVI